MEIKGSGDDVEAGIGIENLGDEVELRRRDGSLVLEEGWVWLID